MPKGKKFIDRKNAVTFHLVHRSQQDPLAADDKAPQRVLLPVVEKPKISKDKEKQIDEQKKFGIFFDDDYNYLQHLRDPNKMAVDWEKVERVEAPPKIKLPSSVFASKHEENVGLLNKAAPQSGLRLDLDPDVVAAMDEDFDYDNPDNELEDDFIELANAEGGDEENSDVDSNFDSDADYSDEEKDEVASLNGPQYTFADEETKSRFTDYSMSSSVMRRNQQLSLLDDRFEMMYAGYDETEIGALDCEEIEGYVDPNSEQLKQLADEYERDQERKVLRRAEILEELKHKMEFTDDEEEEEDDMMYVSIEEDRDKWDCESILSTYSNIYNHPKMILTPPYNEQILINKKTGMPINILGAKKLTPKVLSIHDAQYNQFDTGAGGVQSACAKSLISVLSSLSVRPKNESSEARRERKQNLKEYRRARRLEKKANVEAFKEEAIRQQKIAINNKNNIQGNRIL